MSIQCVSTVDLLLDTYHGINECESISQLRFSIVFSLNKWYILVNQRDFSRYLIFSNQRSKEIQILHSNTVFICVYFKNTAIYLYVCTYYVHVNYVRFKVMRKSSAEHISCRRM